MVVVEVDAATAAALATRIGAVTAIAAVTAVVTAVVTAAVTTGVIRARLADIPILVADLGETRTGSRSLTNSVNPIQVRIACWKP